MPPPAKNFLMPEQVSQLQQALKESNQPHVRERILIIVLQNNGKPQHEIAKFLGCSPRTVAYWCMHGDPDNLETLHNKREYEHYRKVTPEYIELLLKTVDQEPSDLGYEFGKWTAERLATYLTEKTGIDLSSSQVRRILKRKKYSYIWAKYDLEHKQNLTFPVKSVLQAANLHRGHLTSCTCQDKPLIHKYERQKVTPKAKKRLSSNSN